jgi:hypothetical protein
MATVTKRDPVTKTVVTAPGGITLELSMEEAAYVTGLLGRSNELLAPEGCVGLYSWLYDALGGSSAPTRATRRASAYGHAHAAYVRNWGKYREFVDELKLSKIGEIE